MNSVVPQGYIASTVGVEAQNVNLQQGIVGVPLAIAVLGQANTGVTITNPNEPMLITSSGDASRIFGAGSPLHLMIKQLIPQDGNGAGSVPVYAYPLEEAVGAVASTASITFTGTATKAGTYDFIVGGVSIGQIAIAKDDTDADIANKVADAINAVLDIPFTAVANLTAVELTAKWAGETGNEIAIRLNESPTASQQLPEGVSVAVAEFAGGLVDPSIATALESFCCREISHVVNPYFNEVALDALQALSEQEWQPTGRHPFVSISGHTSKDNAAIVAIQAILDARRTDRVNCIVPAWGSESTKFEIAAATAGVIASRASKDIAQPYGGLYLTNIDAGRTKEQPDYIQKDVYLKAGISNTTVENGLVKIKDIITFYRPEGDVDPAYRYVVDVMKVKLLRYNLDVLFKSDDWEGKILVPSKNNIVSNPNARSPQDAISAVRNLWYSATEQAVIVDLEFASANVFASIDAVNRNRLNVNTTVKLSGSMRVISVLMNFGFYYGNNN